jgi:nitronate monooxygenase
MKFKTKLVQRLGIEGPLILAPLGGGPGTPELAAMVSNAGALGSLGGAYLSAGELQDAIRKTRTLTSKPFAVNLFIPSPASQPTSEQVDQAIAVTQKYRDELALPAAVIKSSPFEDFSKQMAVILDEKPAVLSFVFGVLDKSYVKQFQSLGIMIVGTATNLEEGLKLQNAGVDAVVAQGCEAGGHRGMFTPEQADSDLKTEALTQLLVKGLRIPVIASGGIMDGKGIARALSWGAQAAQLGTAFLLCPEAGTSQAYRQALRKTSGDPTKLTRVFSGRLARGIENRFMQEMESQQSALLPWPVQNAFTRDLRSKSAQNQSADFLSLWAGQGVAMIREMSAADLVKQLFAETRESF